MIGGGVQEVEAVRIAQSMGLRVIVTDRNPDAPCFDLADFKVVVDGRDIEGLVSFALLNKERLDIAGVFTLTELVTSVAAVAQAVGLPGVPLRSAVVCQNKLLCKAAWRKGGIPTPEGDVVDSYEDAQRLFDRLGGRAFIKPLVGFGGRGAARVLSEDDLKDAFSGPGHEEMLMEELVSGSMHDVNGVFDSRGIFHPLGCFDRYFHPEHPVEIGAVYPSRLSETEVAGLYDLTERAARTLGITVGPVKADLVRGSDGFKVLEMAPRLHGPKGTLLLTAFAGGVNHLETVLKVITGGDLGSDDLDMPERVSMYRALLPEPGYLRSVSGIDDALGINGVERVLVLTSVGGLIPEYTDSTAVPCYVFTSGSDLEDADSHIKEAMRLIDFETIKEKEGCLWNSTHICR